ncbi:TetR family transcriptional regulator [Pseudothioclava nitratireducens]|uniref:TetR family transcriptional regulator n=1 Tax=Pseudothioclava nitratireducens TaxID=1928646 RepID=UPI0023D9B56D|nr:TetR family transcriptional regulator [Defluviimonas nitratireducens]MDF1618963.1 TetR family transcriptional regulator [Defluviimonas nitratireducens]
MARKAGSHSEITGPKIRAEAQRLFARHGFAAVSMRQIAAAVGVQAGALYLYTPDKEALLVDLLKTHMDELIAAWRAISKSNDPTARLEEFVRFHIRFNLERAEAVFLSYMELRNLSPENFAVIEDLRKTYETELEAILKSGQDAGVFQLPDSKLATMAIIAMLTGVNTWFREGGRLSRDKVETIYWDMVRKAVGA